MNPSRFLFLLNDQSIAMGFSRSVDHWHPAILSLTYQVSTSAVAIKHLSRSKVEEIKVREAGESMRCAEAEMDGNEATWKVLKWTFVFASHVTWLDTLMEDHGSRHTARLDSHLLWSDLTSWSNCRADCHSSRHHLCGRHADATLQHLHMSRGAPVMEQNHQMWRLLLDR